ncbi:glycosyltransferase involved in cell wall biosynthesis [Pseudonocardia kunmingensis]|uniref:Glycosyltransferase involved in cell wall biosynthesis n=1 Tax=Pseudonocardia kunmingensis TaxID=630975 RepID=A0A543DZR7_9PSEU|nr:glycosyltransferase involved in cell wall biosynthesis [Pseudonocardia kunmingensis]
MVPLLRGSGVRTIVAPAAAKLDRSTLRQVRSSVKLLGRLVDTFRLAARLGRADVVHSNTTGVLGGPVLAGLLRAPHVWTVREIIERPAAVRKAIGSALRFGSKAVTYNSRATAEFWLTVAPTLAMKSTVVANQVSVPNELARRCEARTQLGLGPDDVVVAILGRINEWKGHDVLLSAFEKLAARWPHLRLLIAGSAPPGQEWRVDALRDRMESASFAARVQFVGFLPEPGPVYAAADIVVVPSTRPEPFGRVAVEAAHYGVPVVAAEHGGLREIVHHEETGLLVAPGSATDLAATLSRLAGDEALRMHLGTEAQRRARGFSVEAIADQYLEVYRRAANDAGA